jgi:hypothetical protein
VGIKRAKGNSSHSAFASRLSVSPYFLEEEVTVFKSMAVKCSMPGFQFQPYHLLCNFGKIIYLPGVSVSSVKFVSAI